VGAVAAIAAASLQPKAKWSTHMRTSTKCLVTDANKHPIGIIVEEAELGKLSVKQLRQAIRNFGPGDLLVIRTPTGQYRTHDASAGDFELVDNTKIHELGGSSFNII
jgi:hypothetical protein